jgi:hypothetical protein
MGMIETTADYLSGRRYHAVLEEPRFPIVGGFEHSRLVVEHRTRKLLLGKPVPAGRFYVDLELLIAAEHDAGDAALADLRAGAR